MNKIMNITVVLCALFGTTACAALNGDSVDRADRKANALMPRTPKTPFNEALAVKN